MKTLILRTMNSAPSLAPLLLRLPIGLILMAHGAQKLFGWFGGYGLEGTGQWMASIGLTPGFIMALLAGFSEFFGGLFLILGLFTRLSALVLSFTMIVAIASVHIHNGLFLTNNGYEFGLALLAATLSLTISGAGRLAVDNLLASRIR